MKHDDLCVDQDNSKESCSVCSLINRVRRDEQDRLAGGEDWNRELAYSEGFEAGLSQTSGAKSGGISLMDMKGYILDRISTLNETQMKALYDMYVNFGGE